MRYERFEGLVLIVGVLAVGGTIAASIGPQAVVEEIVAQALLLIVLIGALHWGRTGGFLTAVAAVVLYMLMRVLAVSRLGLTAPIIELIVIRVVSYGIVGIVGGEVCGRIKYIFARLEDDSNVDEETRIYNGRYVAQLLRTMIGRHQRYGESFSVVTIDLAPGLFTELRPSRKRAIMRQVATHVRNDIRVVDDVGRLEGDRLVVLLPHTPGAGAIVARDRLVSSVRDMLGARESSVTAEAIAAPEDVAAIEALCANLETIAARAAAESATQSAS